MGYSMEVKLDVGPSTTDELMPSFVLLSLNAMMKITEALLCLSYVGTRHQSNQFVLDVKNRELRLRRNQ